jgi:hypothetical protein
MNKSFFPHDLKHILEDHEELIGIKLTANIGSNVYEGDSNVRDNEVK